MEFVSAVVWILFIVALVATALALVVRYNQCKELIVDLQSREDIWRKIILHEMYFSLFIFGPLLAFVWLTEFFARNDLWSVQPFVVMTVLLLLAGLFMLGRVIWMQMKGAHYMLRHYATLRKTTAITEPIITQPLKKLEYTENLDKD